VFFSVKGYSFFLFFNNLESFSWFLVFNLFFISCISFVYLFFSHFFLLGFFFCCDFVPYDLILFFVNLCSYGFGQRVCLSFGLFFWDFFPTLRVEVRFQGFFLS